MGEYYWNCSMVGAVGIVVFFLNTEIIGPSPIVVKLKLPRSLLRCEVQNTAALKFKV